MTGANRIEASDSSSPCSNWGKHKHRRFIVNSLDLDLAAAAAAALPWNLRNRVVKRESEEESEKKSKKSKRVRSKMAKKESDSRRLEVRLSKSEIEEDFFKMLATKPPSRPKKRPRAVQKHINFIFPGFCLPKIPAAHIYDIPKSPSSLKKIKGVKA